MNESIAKREQFRVQIRRRQVEEIFSMGRIRFQEEQKQEQSKQLQRQMNSMEKRRSYIYMKMDQMGHQPCMNWSYLIQELSKIVQYFEGDYCDWIESGIICNLLKLFKQEFLELGLSEKSAELLRDVFYYLPADSQQVNTILQYQFILDLVQLCSPPHLSAIHYYQLISSIISQRQRLRDKFISNGLVQTLAVRLKLYKNLDCDEVFCALVVVYKLVKVYQYEDEKLYPKGNTISIFISILNSLICDVKCEESISIILKIFHSFAISQKQYVYNTLFTCQNMISVSLYVLTMEGNPLNRMLGANILSSMSNSKNIAYAKQFVRKGILGQILECSRLPNNHAKCLHLLLSCLDNIIANSMEQAEAVISHAILGEFIISFAKSSNKSPQHEYAIYCLCSIIDYRNHQMVKFLLKKHDLLEIFVTSLSYHAPQPDTCIKILKSLDILVEMFNEVSGSKQNRIICDLERFYNIQNILAKLEEKMENNPKIFQRVSKLYEDMYGS